MFYPLNIIKVVSMGVSKLWRMDLIFIDGGVKINGAYYNEMLVTQKLLPATREICAVFFTSQQCNAPAAAREREK